MKFRPSLLRLLSVLLLGVAAKHEAHAATIASGNFANDASSLQYIFNGSAQNYTFSTTSFAAGGFLPVLTLFNTATGKPVDYSNSGLGDVAINDVLDNGQYELFLTEYPNVANGNLADGFLFEGDPTATGDSCGYGNTGKSFVNATTCSSTALGSNYNLNLTTSPLVASTPEPSSLLLMLAPTGALVQVARRRRLLA